MTNVKIIKNLLTAIAKKGEQKNFKKMTGYKNKEALQQDILDNMPINTFKELMNKLMSISLSFENDINIIPKSKDYKGSHFYQTIGEPKIYTVMKDERKDKLVVHYNFHFESKNFNEIYKTLKTLRELDLKLKQKK